SALLSKSDTSLNYEHRAKEYPELPQGRYANLRQDLGPASRYRSRSRARSPCSATPRSALRRNACSRQSVDVWAVFPSGRMARARAVATFVEGELMECRRRHGSSHVTVDTPG